MSIGIESLLSAVGLKRKARIEGRKVGFLELVRRVAEGEETNADRIEESLDAVNKTPEDLATSVEVHHRRTSAKTALGEIPSQERKAASVRAKMAAENAKLEAARDAHEKAIWPLDFELQQLNAATGQRQSHLHLLQATCPDPELTERREGLRKEINSLANGPLHDVKRIVRELDDRIEAAERRAKHEGREKYAEEIDRLKRRRDERQKEADALQSKLDQLRAEEADIVAKMIAL